MSEQAIIMQLGGFNLVTMERDKYPLAEGRANGYFCPGGSQPGIGYVLMLRSDWDKISSGVGVPVSLTFGTSPGAQVIFPELFIVNAIKVSRGPAGDPNAVYMVKLTDKRWHARLTDCALQINVRCPAPPATSGTGMYYADSLDSGSLYTWTRACAVIWNLIPNFGTYPGLPVVPDGNPEGFSFVGVPAIDALQALLDRISCELIYNPMSDTFSIVQSGTIQIGLVLALLQSLPYVVDAEPVDVLSALMPEKVRVYFHRRDKHYGTEHFTQAATGAWTTSAWYKVDVATSNASIAGTVVSVWDDLPAIYDFSNTLTNSTALNTRANERAANVVSQITISSGRLRTRYQGVVSAFLPGSQLNAVWWHNFDSSDGLLTEVFNHPGTPAVPDLDDLTGGGTRAVDEALSPPDLGRHTSPNYPPLVHVVQVDGTGATPTSANAGGFWAGHVYRIDPEAAFTSLTTPYTASEACWLAAINHGSEVISSLPAGDRFLGKLNGTATYGGDKRPLYLIRADSSSTPQKLVKTTSSISSAASGTVNIWDNGSGGSETISTGPVTATAWNRTSVTIASGKFCLMTTITIGGSPVNYLEPWEC